MRGPAGLLLLGRPHCHLCEELAEDLAARFPPGSYSLQEACVDDRPEWREAHGSSIPVLLGADGSVICRVRLDVEAVRAYLSAQSGA